MESTERSNDANRSKPQNFPGSWDYSLQLESTTANEELPVITDQHAVVNMLTNSVHTARHGPISGWLKGSKLSGT